MFREFFQCGPRQLLSTPLPFISPAPQLGRCEKSMIMIALGTENRPPVAAPGGRFYDAVIVCAPIPVSPCFA
jgi:hypothetical protein